MPVSATFCMVDEQIVKSAAEQLLALRAMKVLIFSETTMARQDLTCKQNGTRRWGLGIGLMAGVGGHWIPMTK